VAAEARRPAAAVRRLTRARERRRGRRADGGGRRRPTAAGGWPLAGDNTAGGAGTDAAADAMRSVSPPVYMGGYGRAAGGGGVCRRPHLRQRSQRWRRARRLVARRSAVARARAPRCRLQGCSNPSPLRPRVSIRPPTPAPRVALHRRRCRRRRCRRHCHGGGRRYRRTAEAAVRGRAADEFDGGRSGVRGTGVSGASCMQAARRLHRSCIHRVRPPPGAA